MQNFQISQCIRLASLLYFSSPRERSVKRQWPLTMSQLSLIGNHETGPLNPQNVCTVPTGEQCPSSETRLQHMLPSYRAHTEADWTRFPTVPSPCPSPARMHKMVCYYSFLLSQTRNAVLMRRSSGCRQSSLDPELRSGGRVEKSVACPVERMLAMALGKGAKTSTSSLRMQPVPPTSWAGTPNA